MNLVAPIPSTAVPLRRHPEGGPRPEDCELVHRLCRCSAISLTARWGSAERSAGWLADGSLRALEQWIDGLERAPAVLANMLAGRNTGEVLVRVSDDAPA